MNLPARKRSWLNTSVRWVWQLFALMIIILASLVVLGRQAIINLPQYQQQIQDQMSSQLGASVRFERIDGEWTGMSPAFWLRNLTIHDGNNSSQSVIHVQRVEAQPDLLASLYHRRLVLRRLVVADMQLSLSEDASGTWSVGLPMSGESDNSLELVESLLFKSRLIRIESVEMQVNFHSGASAPVVLNKVDIENSENFHRLVASVSVSKDIESARIELEGWGSPMAFDQFKGNLYLKINEINNIGLIQAALVRWLPSQFREMGEVHTEVNGELWLTMDGGGNGKINGYLSAAEIPLNWNSAIPPLQDFYSEITGKYLHGNSWSLTAQQLVYTWDGTEIPPTSFNYTQKAGDSWGEGRLTVSQIDLAVMKKFLLLMDNLPEPALRAIRELNPSGLIAPLSVSLEVAENKKLAIHVSGNLQNVAVDSYAKGPAARQINGYFEMLARGSEQLGGFVEIDSPQGLSMWYPTAYDNYMLHGSARGRVDWRLDEEGKTVQVTSGPLHVDGEEGVGQAYLNLNLPLNDEFGSPQMILQVGMRNSHSRYRNRYIPNVLNDELLQWLEEAIGPADVPEAGFIWRGSLSGNESEQRSIQLYLRTRDGQLKFQPDWPAIENMTASLIVNDIAAEGNLSQGRIANLNLQSAQYALLPSADNKPLTLEVKSEASGAVKDAMSLLLGSPVKDALSALQDWQTSGNVSAKLNLAIPLEKGHKPYINVIADLQSGQLIDPTETLNFDRLATSLIYDSVKGLSAKVISGRLWESPVKASLQTKNNIMTLLGSGRFTVASVAKNAKVLMEKVSLEKVLSGKSRFQAELHAPLQGTAGQQSLEIIIKSSLEGVAVDLPEPFRKTPDQKRESTFNIRLDDTGWHVSGQLEKLLGVDFHWEEGGLHSGFLGINQLQREGWLDQNFLVQGHMQTFDVESWNEVLERFPRQGESPDFPMPFIDLKVEEFGLFDLQLQSVSLTGSKTPLTASDSIGSGSLGKESWRFAFTSELADGQVVLPETESQPIRLSLSRLSLISEEPSADVKEQPSADVKEEPSANANANVQPSEDVDAGPDPTAELVEESPADSLVSLADKEDSPAGLQISSEEMDSPAVQVESQSPLAGLDPTTLPLLNFSVDKLFVNERLYGSLSFNMIPEKDGVRLTNLQGEIGNFRIGSAQDVTELYWMSGEQEMTTFAGSLQADNIATVFEFWSFPEMMDSKQSHLQTEVLWHGRPDQFALTSLRGSMTFSAEQGTFYSSPAAPADAAIRAVSLVNFANWVRRLRLDFSDIFKKGISYDELQGGIEFNEGLMRFEPAIEVKMPSGRMMLSGHADLNSEQLDANLAMTIPVSTNLPWIAALVGGLPAAAGVYLTSKLFEDEVDRLSSFNYSLKGPWAEPDVSIEKIFSDKP